MSISSVREQITQVVSGWSNVTSQPHRFGGTEYRLGRREIGHIHGDYMVDAPFPTKIGHQLVREGKAQPHHILPECGWVSFYINQPEDIQGAITLLRKSYQLALKQQQRKSKSTVAIMENN